MQFDSGALVGHDPRALLKVRQCLPLRRAVVVLRTTTTRLLGLQVLQVASEAGSRWRAVGVPVAYEKAFSSMA
jgi:hypothetical protein